MKNLRRGSKGQDVLVLQRFLKKKGYFIRLDASYGPATALAVYWYQKNEGLQSDGKFGPGCRRSMEHAKMCKYQEFKYDRQTTIIRMRRNVTTAKVLNPKRQTIKQMFKSLVNKPDLIINGTLFDTKTGTDLAHLKVDNQEVGVGYYDDDGLGIGFAGAVTIGKDSNIFNEFMGFSPAIYLNGKKNEEYKDLSSSFLNARHPRTMVQVTDNYINVFIIRGRSAWRGWKGANIYDLRTYALEMAFYDQSISTHSAGIFDGGGSTGAYTKRGTVYGWISRLVANGVAFYVKGM